MNIIRVLKPLAVVAVLAGVAVAGYFTRDHWLPLLLPPKPAERVESDGEAVAPTGKVIVNEQAQVNLGLTAKPLKAQTFWKTIPVPGMVVDRPGQSDRGVVAPASGVVSKLNRFPGDTVQPGDVLFTLKLLSETLFLTQTDLFKSTQDIALAQAQRKRLTASAGAIPEARLIEVDNQITRLEVALKAYRQELLNRGFAPDMIDGVAGGKYVNEIAIVVPPVPPTPGRRRRHYQLRPGRPTRRRRSRCRN